MSKKQRNWGIVNIIIGLLSALFTGLSIFTEFKAQKYEEEMMFEDLEERYILVKKPETKKEKEGA